jgi:hypothetical protein
MTKSGGAAKVGGAAVLVGETAICMELLCWQQPRSLQTRPWPDYYGEFEQNILLSSTLVGHRDVIIIILRFPIATPASGTRRGDAQKEVVVGRAVR